MAAGIGSWVVGRSEPPSPAVVGARIGVFHRFRVWFTMAGMELRAFAEQVLFATTLEEKLRAPEAITDARPGAPLLAPATPGRPPALRFKESKGADGSGGASWPLSRLERLEERGRLLHFFANHELLATELMALVLLRFPEAPPAFRRGVFQTLRDEQEHTRLYLERLRACGVEFGELPVSGYFWRVLAGMENPIDYVAGLSLTFEQANLDFARHFARGFARVGDAAGAALLERIYRDEIGHVAYGLKWFRRWKNPGESDWAAFCRQLKYPLSPQRAKGFALNIEGRRAAGFDSQFIAELDVYSRSKGRTPGVYVFNPFAEAYVARGRAFTPVKPQAQLACDLANLPQFLCRQDDIVLVPSRPSVEFLSSLKQAGFALPEFVELGDSPARMRAALAALAGRRLGRLCPWAWGPDAVDLLSPLFAAVTGETRTADQRFNPGLAELYSKAWSASMLGSLLADSDAEDRNWLCGEGDVGVAVESISGARVVIDGIRARGHHRVVVKEALGLAGGNAIRLWEPDLLPTQLRWMEKRLQAGATLVVEPWLERRHDFSVQFEMGPDGLKLRGFTTLLTDLNGQYLGNVAAPNCARQWPAAVAQSLARPGVDIAVRLRRLLDRIRLRLEDELARRRFVGPVGLDAFVYVDDAGRARLKPVVEINPRFTMGRLALELMRHVCPGSQGCLRLVKARASGKADGPGGGCIEWANRLREGHPVRLEGEPVPRIREGTVMLNDPAAAGAILAVWQVTVPRASPDLPPGDFGHDRNRQQRREQRADP